MNLQKESQNLEDAESDIMMLDEEEEEIMYSTIFMSKITKTIFYGTQNFFIKLLLNNYVTKIYICPLPRCHIGEFFVYCKQTEALARIENMKAEVDSEIELMQGKADKYKKILEDLKVQLYAKFGNNINLEADED